MDGKVHQSDNYDNTKVVRASTGEISQKYLPLVLVARCVKYYLQKHFSSNIQGKHLFVEDSLHQFMLHVANYTNFFASA